MQNSDRLDLGAISTYKAGVLQSQAHRKLKKAMADFLKPHNLTMMEWFTLGLIKDAGEHGIRMSDLSNELQTTLPYTTNLINHLSSKGFVSRRADESDSRSKLLTLTPNVSDTCDKIEISLRENMRKLIYSNISPDDLSTYIKVLYKIAEES